MEPQINPQSSSSSSSSSFNNNGARVFPLTFYPTQNCLIIENQNFSSETQTSFTENQSGNGFVTVAGIAIERLRFIDQLTNGEEQEEWEDIEERFDQIASTTRDDSVPSVNRSDFAFCIGMSETPEFADELLSALKERKDLHSEITKSKLYEYWNRITDSSFDSRIRIFFDLCDRNMDGKITQMEIKQVILLSASANKLSMTNEEAGEYAALIMEELDTEQRGYIELSQLETLFKESSTTREASLLSVDQNNDQGAVVTTTSDGSWGDDDPYVEPMSSAEVAFRTYWRRAWIVTLWVIICCALFMWKFMQYRNRKAFQVMGYCLCTAKGAAETLKFNMALILLPVCRNTVTWLRKNRSLNTIIPFNDNVNFHKLIAGGIVVGVVLHGGTHLTCDFPRIAGCNRSIFRHTLASGFGHHQPSYFEILATTEAATGIIMVILMAIAFTLATHLPRRRPTSLPRPLREVTGFNTFWYTHHLFILVYVLLIVHSMFLFLTKDVAEKTIWIYLAIPVLLYAGERTVRALRAGFYDVKIVKATTYPGKVLSLTLSKPADFKYRSGMYIYLQCPQISPLEWHPFSLTSAPEDDHLSVHIRTLGDWSYQIYSLFQEAIVSGSPQCPRIHVDGPYGAASQDHIKYDIVVLIGLGIGATPFISVIKDIVHTLEQSLEEHITDEESGVVEGSSKAYLYWVTREQGSFAWFRDVMKEISETHQKKAMIEMHNYLTSVYQDGDARSTLISAIQYLHQAKTGIDVLSQTPVKTHFARPNWQRVFTNLASKHGGKKIGVFYCGPPDLAKELKRLCVPNSPPKPQPDLYFTRRTTEYYVSPLFSDIVDLYHLIHICVIHLSPI